MNTKKILKTTVSTLITTVIITFVVLVVIAIMVTRSMSNKHINFNKTWEASEYGLTSQHIFTTTTDGFKISSWEVAVDTPKAVIICLSGIQNPSVTGFYGHAKMFSDNGYASILTDVRGHGESDGQNICLGYNEPYDVNSVVSYIKSKPEYANKPVVVMGLSMGALIAINSIGQNDSIDGLISLSAPSAWEDMFYDSMIQQAPKFLAYAAKPIVQIVAAIKFGENPIRTRAKSAIKRIGTRPALLMHTKLDSEVGFGNFERIKKGAPQQTEYLVREIDEHFITSEFFNPQVDTTYSQTILNFLNRNFDQAE